MKRSWSLLSTYTLTYNLAIQASAKFWYFMENYFNWLSWKKCFNIIFYKVHECGIDKSVKVWIYTLHSLFRTIFWFNHGFYRYLRGRSVKTFGWLTRWHRTLAIANRYAIHAPSQMGKIHARSRALIGRELVLTSCAHACTHNV